MRRSSFQAWCVHPLSTLHLLPLLLIYLSLTVSYPIVSVHRHIMALPPNLLCTFGFHCTVMRSFLNRKNASLSQHAARIYTSWCLELGKY